MEGLGEASRIYGNLSREKDIRDFLVKEKGKLMLLKRLLFYSVQKYKKDEFITVYNT